MGADSVQRLIRAGFQIADGHRVPHQASAYDRSPSPLAAGPIIGGASSQRHWPTDWVKQSLSKIYRAQGGITAPQWPPGQNLTDTPFCWVPSGRLLSTNSRTLRWLLTPKATLFPLHCLSLRQYCWSRLPLYRRHQRWGSSTSPAQIRDSSLMLQTESGVQNMSRANCSRDACSWKSVTFPMMEQAPRAKQYCRVRPF